MPGWPGGVPGTNQRDSAGAAARSSNAHDPAGASARGRAGSSGPEAAATWTNAHTQMLATSWAEAWTRIKTNFAITAPVYGFIALVGAITSPVTPEFSTANHVILALTAAVVLAVWAWRFAVPFATRGRLPSGCLLADVMARERLRRRKARRRRDLSRKLLDADDADR
jgi:hypothetical protein